MIRAFGLAFAQLFDPRILRWAGLSVLITLGVYGLLIAGLIFGLSHVALAAIPWLDSLARWGSGVAIFLNGITFLLVIVVLVAVNPRETPTLAPDTRVFQALREGASFVWHNLPFRAAVCVAFASAACRCWRASTKSRASAAA